MYISSYRRQNCQCLVVSATRHQTADANRHHGSMDRFDLSTLLQSKPQIINELQRVTAAGALDLEHQRILVIETVIRASLDKLNPLDQHRHLVHLGHYIQYCILREIAAFPISSMALYFIHEEVAFSNRVSVVETLEMCRSMTSSLFKRSELNSGASNAEKVAWTDLILSSERSLLSWRATTELFNHQEGERSL